MNAKTQNKTVIYTAIFGEKDNLIEPKFIPNGCDFVCFTDQDFTSDIWDVRKVEPTFEDPVRSAKMYKVLPHKFLSEYEYSVWIDGNFLVKGDVNKLIKEYLETRFPSGVNMAVFSHNENKKRWKKLFWIKDRGECRDCIYDEAKSLIDSYNKDKYKDNPNLIKAQVEKYRQDGYPEHNGLIVGMVLVRRHNKPDIVKVMEDWWNEIKDNSRRDQLSFNYVAWKNNLNFTYMKGCSRRNKYFLHLQHKTRQNFKS